MTEITAENFSQSQAEFTRKNPDLWLMIRPDRPHDQTAHKYPDDDARRKGNTAMKAWFEYLAAKGFTKAFNTWRAMLKSGHSIMVVCESPLVFDIAFVPPARVVLAAEFWDEFEQSRIPIDRRYELIEDHDRIIAGFANLQRELRTGKGQPRVLGWSTLGDATGAPLRGLEAAE